jgi:hypothetical protein
MFAGVDGEHILAARNNMSSPGYIAEYFIGVATQNFALNEFGYVTVFGKVNKLNTLAYTVGDLLYADPAVIGGLTKVEPQAPNLHIIVAAVTKRSGGDGHILVRPSFRPKLSNLSDVQITNIANNNLIKYNSANSRFENVSASSVIEPAYAQANTATTLAQSAYNYANTIVVPNLSGYAVNTTTDLIWSTSNSAWQSANSAQSLAQAAYNYANTIVSDTQIDPLARSTANGAFAKANNAYDVANAAWNYANTIVSDTQIDPLARSTANGAFDKANNSYDVANAAWATANAGYTKANTSYDTANAAYDNSNSAFAKANNSYDVANAAWNYANNIVVPTLTGYAVNTTTDLIWSTANSAYTQANTATTNASDANTKAQSAFNQANTATTLAQAAYDYANTIVVPSLSGYAVNTTTNLIWSTANSAYTQANNSTVLAQAAYDHANTGLAKDYTLNTVTSNTLIANTDSRELFLCDTSNNVVLTMPAGNTVSNGFNFKVTRLGSGEVALAGTYPDTKIRGIKFGDISLSFNSVNDETLSAYSTVELGGEYTPSSLALSNFENQTTFEFTKISNTEYALLQGVVLPNDRTVNALTSLINSVWIASNGAYDQANTATTLAQSAYDYANTIVSDTQIDPLARSTANGAFAKANNAYDVANAAYNKANTGTSQLVNGDSTVSLSANGNLTVTGQIGGLGNSKLDFNTYGANTAYLTSTSDDSTALFMGLVSAELYAHTNVQIRANTAGVSKNWTFNADGSTTLPGTVDITYTPDTATGSAITINGANTQGGTGYADFLKVTNTSGGATNPNKTFRLNSTGDLEIINSDYDANLFSLTNAGGLSVSGPISVGGKQAVNGPAFRAYVATGQAITSGSQQKVTFGTENFDTNSNFASSRFTPTIEGYYQLNATVRIDGTSSTGECMIVLYKNGSEYARGHNQSGTEQGASFYSMSVSDIAYANGAGDFFEVYIQQTSGGNRNTTAGSPISYFSGAMVRGA